MPKLRTFLKLFLTHWHLLTIQTTIQYIYLFNALLITPACTVKLGGNTRDIAS